jgi:hypothetical protein
MKKTSVKRTNSINDLPNYQFTKIVKVGHLKYICNVITPWKIHCKKGERFSRHVLAGNN